jgi:hypothetical protein
MEVSGAILSPAAVFLEEDTQTPAVEETGWPCSSNHNVPTPM